MCSSGLFEVDNEEIKAIIDMDRHRTTRDIAEKPNVSHTCIEKSLHKLPILKIDSRVPYDL